MHYCFKSQKSSFECWLSSIYDVPRVTSCTCVCPCSYIYSFCALVAVDSSATETEDETPHGKKKKAGQSTLKTKRLGKKDLKEGRGILLKTKGKKGKKNKEMKKKLKLQTEDLGSPKKVGSFTVLRAASTGILDPECIMLDVDKSVWVVDPKSVSGQFIFETCTEEGSLWSTMTGWYCGMNCANIVMFKVLQFGHC